jgi:hypothetical protein
LLPPVLGNGLSARALSLDLGTGESLSVMVIGPTLGGQTPAAFDPIVGGGHLMSRPQPPHRRHKYPLGSSGCQLEHQLIDLPAPGVGVAALVAADDEPALL